MENFNKRFSDLQNFANFLGNEYVWAKTKLVGKYIENRYRVSGSNIQSGRHDTHVTYTYADSISIDQTDGSITLINPTSVSRDGTYNQNVIAEAIQNKYFTVSGLGYTGVRYCLTATGSSDGTLSITPFDEVTAKYTIETLGFGYVNSPDPNAYPVNDGYTYTALGMLGEKPKIVKGGYVGTGKYGSSNESSLTFDFKPLLISISNNSAITTMIRDTEYTAYDNNASTGGNNLYLTWNENTVSWYNSQSDYQQLNSSGKTYQYIAIG